MKYLLTLIVIILIPNILRADGGMSFYIVKFSIKNINNNISIGYSYVSEGRLNKDSLLNTNYLKMMLDQGVIKIGIKKTA